jgi:hypothetical protein
MGVRVDRVYIPVQSYCQVATVTSGEAVNHWGHDVFRHFPLWPLERYEKRKFEIAARPCTKMKNHLGIKKIGCNSDAPKAGRYTVGNINCIYVIQSSIRDHYPL